MDVTRSAFLEAGQIVDHYYRKGVAAAIIRKAERPAAGDSLRSEGRLE
ncbi:hypothetical protein O9H85_15680 [Paenibacillus filicis]|uniref:Uncharacterized protein n=1 Tax=Paenibacillus gyeongsangnamensis TaxID=3388067 RepID=A0ABT4QAY8_9BACL|nr:hypothetical protein [Paenibacillus filicis]MCZ8513850.1 hypothetical protein [Paenibacillus filicis]